ncbi:MAG: lytic transglycosylase domain-containing protein, partial [Brevinematia bacterium]
RFVSPNTPDLDKFNISKLLLNFDKQNYDLYKSFVIYKIKDSNTFLMDIPYDIIDSMDQMEKSKIKSMLKKIKDEYVVVSKIVRSKMVYKGLSNVFSYLVVIRNRLEMKITKGIYNEGNNITANKFIDAYSKFLPFSIQEVLYPIPYVSDVIYSAEKFGIDPNLVYAVMKQESFFQEEAYSRAGAIGLMQVLYSTGKLVAKKLDMSDILSTRTDLFRTDVNIFLGTAYLSILIDSYGDLNHAISAYNGGPRVFMKTKKRYRISLDDSVVFSEFLAFRETKQYIKRVVKYYNVYSSIYNFDIVKKDFETQNIEELKSKLKELQEKLSPSERELEDDE